MRGGAPGALAGGGSEPSERGGPPLRPNPPSSPPQTSPAGSPPPRPGVSSEPSALIPQSPCPHACPAQPQLQATARPPTAPARLPTPAGPWVPDSHGSAAAPLGYRLPPSLLPQGGCEGRAYGRPCCKEIAGPDRDGETLATGAHPTGSTEVPTHRSLPTSSAGRRAPKGPHCPPRPQRPAGAGTATAP